MTETQTNVGIHEFIFGALKSERDELLAFWEVLGFTVADEAHISASTASELYGHEQGLTSLRLRHKGCDTFETGLVRLQLWDVLRNEGMGNTLPLTVGSRWMGLYCNDILQAVDSFDNPKAKQDWDLWMSPLVHAALQHPPPDHNYFERFIGLREKLIFGKRFRLAMIQRGGFDRPGFGTIDETLPFKNSEGSHANVVQPDNSFSSDFYKKAFGFETAPFGEAHDSGEEPPTIAALELREGETFHIERTRAVNCPSGLLQIYSSYMAGPDHRDLSRPGSGNLCAYSVKVRDLDLLKTVIEGTDGASVLADADDEFGERSLVFEAPDGYVWIAISE